jgi:predicted PurR-regulated permease PerM
VTAKISEIPVLLIIAAAFVVIVAGMKAAAAILIPFLLAVFIATLCSPLLTWLRRRRVPNGLAVLLIVLGLLVASLLLMTFLGRSLTSLAQQLPAQQERLAELTTRVVDWLNSHGLDIDRGNVLLTDYFSPRFFMSLVSYGLSILRVLITNLFLILLFVLFILLEASGLPRKLQAAFDDPETMNHFKTVTDNVNRYMGLKTLISLATGLFIWLLLTLIGVQFAGTWAILAFFLNFIPSIGSIIAAVPAIVWALVQMGFSSALLTLLAYLVVNIVIGNFLDPRLIGRRVGLSTLVVFISMFFWGWVLGPVGMLLSVPLTMILKIALASSDDTRWLAVLLE